MESSFDNNYPKFLTDTHAYQDPKMPNMSKYVVHQNAPRPT